ncbi:hypothetical protein GCM10011369_23470 [Neiella marina]|uniref:Uncharacterized protein n=1 Tax=Neiella marina TaxID=508461 RepID=A0A8J2U607_9GAMM|nr:hypothetical protein [Neiella marina]GGA80812.1 hypothetical protein GCM10011369_23470 [Neiella marina]
MAILPSKFLALSECSFDSTDETYQPNGTGYNRATSKKAFSQVFDLELVTKKLTMETAFELVAWLIDNTAGTHGIFQIENPFNVLLPPLETNALVTREAISESAKAAPAQNFTGLIVGALKPGTFFNFGNHPKVYMVTNSPNANAAGQGTITFTPACYEDVPAGTAINYGANCLFQGSSKADVQSLTASVASGRRTPIVIPFKERGDD